MRRDCIFDFTKHIGSSCDKTTNKRSMESKRMQMMASKQQQANARIEQFVCVETRGDHHCGAILENERKMHPVSKPEGCDHELAPRKPDISCRSLVATTANKQTNK
mmetsp:Transcript_13622/g.38996  ORF Transcript_13622/g.38996 Transcript_13622/m.38996 type:complete len:106 (-) Transcript_13622:29-346(-)